MKFIKHASKSAKHVPGAGPTSALSLSKTAPKLDQQVAKINCPARKSILEAFWYGFGTAFDCERANVGLILCLESDLEP